MNDKKLKLFISDNKNILVHTIWRYVRREEEMEEILQEVIIIIWKKFKLFEAHPKPVALLKKICINASIDHLRRESKRDRDVEIYNELEFKGVDVEREIDFAKKNKIIINSISSLSKKQGIAVLLRIVEEKSYEEIAVILNCSEATVRTHVKRGRKNLKKKLGFLLEG